MKRSAVLVLVLIFLAASLAWAAEEVRPLGMASATGGYSGDIRVGNTCTTSPLGKFYCGLNARHIYFYTDNTVDVDHLYPLAAADTGFPYASGGVWAVDNLAVHRGRLCTGTQDNTTYLRMDGTCAVPPGSGAGAGDMLKSAYDANNDNVVDSAIATAITNGLIVNADVNASAAIAGSKLQDNSVTATKVQCSGTKSSSTYLRMDGTCATVSATPAGDSLTLQVNNAGSFGSVVGSSYDSGAATLTTPALKSPSFTATQTASPGCMKLWEGSGGGTDAIGICAPATVTDNAFWTWPSVDGSDGWLIKTNGAKVLTFVAPTAASSIPSGTDPVVDAAGEIAVDTSINQLRYYGSAEKVLDPRMVTNVTIMTPASGQKVKWKRPYGMTVTEVSCVVDAATSAVLDVQECDANGANCTTILSGTKTCTTTDGNVTLSDTAIAADNYVFFSVGTVTGSVGYLYINFEFTVVKQ